MLVRNRPVLTALWFAVAAIAAAAPSSPEARIDWIAGRVHATGLTRATPTGTASSSHRASTDLALTYASLSMRRLLYRLPVTADETLATVLVRHPNLPALLDRELATGATSPPRMIPPDLLEVDVTVSLSNLRHLLAAVLLDKPPAEKPPSPDASSRPATAVIIAAPAGTAPSPGLLPLLAARETSRAIQLKRLVARHCLAGGAVTYLSPAAAASRTAKGEPTVTADAVGGIGGSCMFLTDADADRVIAALSSAADTKERPELCIVLPRQP